MERPKPLQPDRRFPLWISFLLGMAGVLVTIAGIYELTRERTYTPPTPAPIRQVETSSVTWQRHAAEQREAERQAAIAKLRRQREHAAHEAADGWQARCMDGTLILRRGNEIRSAGRCDQ